MDDDMEEWREWGRAIQKKENPGVHIHQETKDE